MPKNTTTPPRAAQAAKPITPVMQNYVAWLEAETGYSVDPMSVQLSGQLRSTWQAEQRAEKQALFDAIVVPKRTRTRGSTIATAEGVVIAEQSHVKVA